MLYITGFNSVKNTFTLILQCLVSCSCQKSPAKRAIQGHSGQMSSKTILIGLGIFRCGHEKSVCGRPSWELAPYDCTSQITEEFASWCKLVSKECRSSGYAEECRVVHFSTQFFILNRAKAPPIRIGSQIVWQAIRLDFIDDKDKMIAKDYELHDRCDFLC